MSTEGAFVFARFAYPPNELGYCGPHDAQAMLEQTAALVDDGISEAARQFSGAWPYLTFIAGEAGRADPLDIGVVEAYWLGNPLLETVDMANFGNHVNERTTPRSVEGWRNISPAIGRGAVPHHSFHVFAVYPWVGLMRSGSVAEPLHVLDRCRIRWGSVRSVGDDEAVVEAQPLRWDGSRLHLGTAVTESVRIEREGRRLTPRPQPGDVVALHWDWVCTTLTAAQLTGLKHYSNRMMDLVNGLPMPGPAALLS